MQKERRNPKIAALFEKERPSLFAGLAFLTEFRRETPRTTSRQGAPQVRRTPDRAGRERVERRGLLAQESYSPFLTFMAVAMDTPAASAEA